MNIQRPSLGETLKFGGHVQHFIDGRLVYENHNAINDNLKTYLMNSLDTGSADKALNSLFDAGEVALGGAQDGNDGLAIHDLTADVWLSMLTTSIAATNTFGKRWQGQIDGLSQAREIDKSALGFNFDDANTIHFETVYSTQDFTGIPLTAGADYTLEWEIFIQ